MLRVTTLIRCCFTTTTLTGTGENADTLTLSRAHPSQPKEIFSLGAQLQDHLPFLLYFLLRSFWEVLCKIFRNVLFFSLPLYGSFIHHYTTFFCFVNIYFSFFLFSLHHIPSKLYSVLSALSVSSSSDCVSCPYESKEISS